MYKYYSTHCPILPGGYPRKTQVIKIENFDTKIFCEEIGENAWGFIEYQEALTKEETDAYEFTLAGLKTFWCVTTTVNDRGTVRCAITDKIEAVRKPKDISVSKSKKDVYYDWFESELEARQFVEEAKDA